MPTGCDEHGGPAGAFTLIHLGDQRRMGQAEVQSESALYSEPKKAGALESAYGILRAQALAPKESKEYIASFYLLDCESEERAQQSVPSGWARCCTCCT